MIAPIRQDQNYHRFADSRALFGLENAADVLSNAAFLLVGVLGLLFLWRERGRFLENERGRSTRFALPEEMRAYWVLFSAVAATGFGSIYYHLAPDDARIAWDRLSIAVAIMSLLAAVVAERIDVKAGAKLLLPLVTAGAASVLYWSAFDDLRPYVLVQYGSIAVMLALCAWSPSRYSRGGVIFAAAALYGIAKVFEFQDREIYELTGRLVSGHTLKHLVAAAALYAILWSLERRVLSRPSLARQTR